MKDAPGGLRDIEATRILRSLRPDLVIDRPLAEGERLRDAEELLFRLRSLLHVVTGRNSNVLTHELQETVAEAMGYDGAAPQRRVELLMSDYFRRVRPVARALSASREALEPAPPDAALLRRIGRHLEIAVDGVRFVDPARVASMPAMWVEAFRVALANDCGVSEQARTCIEENVDALHG